MTSHTPFFKKLLEGMFPQNKSKSRKRKTWDTENREASRRGRSDRRPGQVVQEGLWKVLLRDESTEYLV